MIPPTDPAVMQVWQAAVLGLVEGLTEYLPVSSTGHLILAASLMGLGPTPETKSAVDAFTIVVQGGAILAVLGLYWPSVMGMVAGVFGRDAAGLRMAVNVLVAFLPAAVLGLLLHAWIEARLFNAPSVLLALALGGVFMIAVDRWKVGPMRRADAAGDVEHQGLELEDLTPARALVIGLLQCVAMWPGTSRSMMTIVGGVMVGLRPRAAAEFSFLLGLPTLGGACVYSLYKDITAAREAGEPTMFETIGPVPIAVGMIVATLSAVVAVRWLVAFLNRHGLAVFGWYRLGLCAVMAALVAAGVVRF